MTYKETLLFIGKCLTISHEEKNKRIVEDKLKSELIDWEYVVEISTAHYVFPALYCNLKRADFLHYLPEELVNYMIYITDLNRERNQQIIAQAKEINELLLANNITPIFLKGTGNLLEDLYEDIGERMLGDIDFLVSPKKINSTNELLLKAGYKNNTSQLQLHSSHRHLPRLTKDDRIGAIEIHRSLLKGKSESQFSYTKIIKTCIKKRAITCLSYENQLIHVILTKQINNNDYKLNEVSLKSVYDIFLMSKKIITLKAINVFPHFFKYTNSYLAISSFILNNPKTVIYKSDKKTLKKLNTFVFLLDNENYHTIRYRILKSYLFVKRALSTVFGAFFNKSDREFVFSRILNLKRR